MKRYIIDGHNLLMARYRSVDAAARQRLLREVGTFARLERASVTVFFDGEPEPGTPREMAAGAVRVLHSGAGHDADGRILSTVGAARHPDAITVVTSDKPLAERCRGRGAQWMSVQKFVPLMESSGRRQTLPRRDGLAPGELREWLEYFGVDGDESSG